MPHGPLASALSVFSGPANLENPSHLPGPARGWAGHGDTGSILRPSSPHQVAKNSTGALCLS